MTRRRAGGVLAVAVGPLGWCLAVGTLVGGDPMLAIELVGGALVVLWAALVTWDLARSHRLAKALSVPAHQMTLFGVPCRVSPELGTNALVVGSFRPRVFVGASLLAALSDDELEAVIYHEDHHRRTRAPLRAAALAPGCASWDALPVSGASFSTGWPIWRRSRTWMRFGADRALARWRGRC